MLLFVCWATDCLPLNHDNNANQPAKPMKTKLIQKSALLLAVCAFTSFTRATAQDTDPYAPPVDPFAASPAGNEEKENDGPADLLACHEVFTLSLAQAASLQREQLSDEELYKRLVAGLKDESVKQEIFNVLRLKSGMSSSNESFLSHIYADEYKEPVVANSTTVGAATHPAKPGATATQPSGNAPTEENISIDGLISPAIPASFEIINLGEQIQIEPSLAADKKTADLRVSFEQDLLVGHTSYGQGLGECKMPEVEARKLDAVINVQIGKPGLLGTFNRPSNSKAAPDSQNLVSYAFVTVTLIQN